MIELEKYGADALLIRNALRAPGLGMLDPITVIFRDYGEGRGKIIVEVCGQAWSHHWGSMGYDKSGSLNTVRTFFAKASTGYLVGKLVLGMWPRHRKHEVREEAYLGDIVEAIKAAIELEGEKA